MPDRIRVRFRDLDMTTLTPAEAASSEFIQINLGMVGCSDCKLASLCNEVGLTV